MGQRPSGIRHRKKKIKRQRIIKRLEHIFRIDGKKNMNGNFPQTDPGKDSGKYDLHVCGENRKTMKIRN